jgi:probable F420-dependent oxidoreductase
LFEYPISSGDDAVWLQPESMAEFARVVEEVGGDAIALTDHPAPSRKWLDQYGGHETLDPFTGLSYFAALTSRVRLMTYLVVVPYRNPLLLAKCMASLDVLSQGRATYVIGAGYLRSEFGALGVEFEERNEIFDESLEVLSQVFDSDSFEYVGKHFTARGQVISPRPVQKPHPPLWLGGNAALTRERVARWGQGWAPINADARYAASTRTAAIHGHEGLRPLLEDLARRLEKYGRSMSDIDLLAWNEPWSEQTRSSYLDGLGRLESLGVSWSSVFFDTSSFDAALDSLRSWGEVRKSLG